jgi:Ca2+-binding RTX toxin-like protein
VHGWHGQAAEYCGHDCYYQIPGSAWQDGERIELGDGNDVFASSMGGTYERSWPTKVSGGSGDDSITTGSGNDTITPGAGNDEVHPGEGENLLIADSRPDGSDTFDLVESSSDIVDDSARSEPLHLAGGVLGAGGEKDAINRSGAEVTVVGGSGDDEFLGRGEDLRGGPGDDKLVGSPEGEFIQGDRGDDTIGGGGGDDFLYGDGGDDSIGGGKGYDLMLGDYGEDDMHGGPGNDKLVGELGDDRLAGGTGDDIVAGNSGDDIMLGGEGKDELRAGYLGFQAPARGPGRGVDTGVDKVDCGPGKDIGSANPWDHVDGCEKQQTDRALMVESVTHDSAQGSATLSYTAYEMGGEITVAVGGRGVRPYSFRAPEPNVFESQGQFVVRARGAALTKLRRTGRVTLTVELTWRPSGTAAAAETRRVGLVLTKPKPTKPKRR